MSEEHIITAVVTSGEKGDGPELPKLLQISQDNGIDIDSSLEMQHIPEKKNILEIGTDLRIYDLKNIF